MKNHESSAGRRGRHAWLVACLALTLTVPSGVAWAEDPPAANTVGSADIIDGQVKYPDLAKTAFSATDIAPECLVLPAKVHTCFGIAGNAVESAEVLNNSLTSADVQDNSLTAADIAPGGVGSSEVVDSGLTGVDVANNMLTGDDINESTLNVGPRIRTRAVAGPGELNSSYATVGSTLSLPSGNWLILAKVTAYSSKYDPVNEVLSATCRLRIGAQDLDQARVWGDNDALPGVGPRGAGTMSMIGWASGGGAVAVQCEDQATATNIAAQMRWHQLRIVAIPANAIL